MPMADATTTKTYVLKPKGRRGRWLLLPCLLVLNGLMGLPVWEGWYQQEQLNKEMQFVRARGEPILPEDFSTPAIADAENAAASPSTGALSLRAGRSP